MSHLPAFLLCLVGFATLSMAMDRQQRDLAKRSLSKCISYILRTTGTCGLLLALGILVNQQGWGFGLVMFSGHASLSAGIVYCMLIGLTRYISAVSRRAY